MQELTDFQRRKLLKNPNVEKITEKHVVYAAEFKVKAVQSYLNGLSPNEIFTNAGINLSFFKAHYTQSYLKKWKKKFLENGKASFFVEKRGSGQGGRPKKENLDELTYEELQAIIEIQKGVIEELKKKRALAKKRY